MKKNIALATLGLFLALCHNGFGQTKFGIKGGVNIASIGGSGEITAARIALHAGIFANGKLSEKIAIQPELIYSQQGGADNGVDFNYNYINLPVILKVFIQNGLNFQLGPQIGLLTSAKVRGFDIKDNINNLDASVALGLGYETSSNIVLDFRYNLGLTNTMENTQDLSFPNQVFQVSIGLKLK